MMKITIIFLIIFTCLFLLTILLCYCFIQLEKEKQRTRDMRQKIFMNRFKADSNKYHIDVLLKEVYKDVVISPEQQKIIDKIKEDLDTSWKEELEEYDVEE